MAMIADCGAFLDMRSREGAPAADVSRSIIGRHAGAVPEGCVRATDDGQRSPFVVPSWMSRFEYVSPLERR